MSVRLSDDREVDLVRDRTGRLLLISTETGRDILTDVVRPPIPDSDDLIEQLERDMGARFNRGQKSRLRALFNEFAAEAVF